MLIANSTFHTLVPFVLFIYADIACKPCFKFLLVYYSVKVLSLVDDLYKFAHFLAMSLTSWTSLRRWLTDDSDMAEVVDRRSISSTRIS